MGEMRKIGIVGGLSPASTAIYYDGLIVRSRARLGKDEYPPMLISSVNTAPFVAWAFAGQWERMAAAIRAEIDILARGGCDFVAIAANTAHKVLPMVESPIDVLSIIDCVAEEAKRQGVSRIGLTGTKFTMGEGFYEEGLRAHGLGVVLPDAREQGDIQAMIFDELIDGRVEASSVGRFGEISEGLLARGAETVLLACTELPMLVGEAGWPGGVATLDSTEVHVEAMFRRAVGEA
jgi:aspartate racemase